MISQACKKSTNILILFPLNLRTYVIINLKWNKWQKKSRTEDMYTPFSIILDGAKVSPQGVMGDIEARLREILHQIATDNGFTLSEIETDSDPLHPFIDCAPQHSSPTIIKALKGVTKRLLFKEFPNFKKETLRWSFMVES
jgi:hypothetical protein